MCMGCRNCIMYELNFDIKIAGQQNESMEQILVNYFKRLGIAAQKVKNYYIVSESVVRELLDFAQDFMAIDELYFRHQQAEWRPLKEVTTILEAQWIDDIIRRKAVVCYSQPIIDEHEEIFGYEVLARFPNEDGTLKFPNEVFVAARQRGRLYALDRLCRMKAVEYSTQLKKKTFINFIPTSIYSPEFCLRSTMQLAKKTGVDFQQFVFEVVETDKVEDINHLKKILRYYNEKGFQYALDDVGEGHSTLEVLAELKPHYMKLDMKYSQDVSIDEMKQKMALNFLRKAQEVRAIPLAEGIENRRDFIWLQQQGYKLFQGYFFGKPATTPQQSIVI